MGKLSEKLKVLMLCQKKAFIKIENTGKKSLETTI